MKKIILFSLTCFTFLSTTKAQETLIDTFAFEWTNVFNSFWGITDVDGMLHLSSDGQGDIYVVDDMGAVVSTVTTDASIDFNHGMVWDGNSYWVAEDFTTGGASLYQLDATGSIQSSFVLPPVNGGNSSGVGGLTMDGTDIWYTVYYPDFDNYPFGYAYKINPSTQELVDTIPLYGKQVYGIANYGDILFYVTDDLDDDEERIYAYSKMEGDTLFSFPLLDPDGDSSPRGLHWFDNHLWLLAKRPGSSAFAYTLLYKYAIDLGTPMLPEMSLTESAIDFGNVEVDETVEANFFIKNEGNAPLMINSLMVDNSVFSVNTVQAPPFEIALSDSVEVTVSFQPAAVESYMGTVTVESNSNTNPSQIVNLNGAGIMITATHDLETPVNFEMYPNPASDILTIASRFNLQKNLRIYFVDSSGAMVMQLNKKPSNTNLINLDVSNLPIGWYTLSLEVDELKVESKQLFIIK